VSAEFELVLYRVLYLLVVDLYCPSPSFTTIMGRVLLKVRPLTVPLVDFLLMSNRLSSLATAGSSSFLDYTVCRSYLPGLERRRL